jgi:hypothetical protein
MAFAALQVRLSGSARLQAARSLLGSAGLYFSDLIGYDVLVFVSRW